MLRITIISWLTLFGHTNFQSNPQGQKKVDYYGCFYAFMLRIPADEGVRAAIVLQVWLPSGFKLGDDALGEGFAEGRANFFL
jgi:hypothetical protein